jgi:ABC-type dipeptide/oligopeptide/nickel transport system permease subunit
MAAANWAWAFRSTGRCVTWVLAGSLVHEDSRGNAGVIYPGLAISLAVFGTNLLGDALRDTLDPRLRGS